VNHQFSMRRAMARLCTSVQTQRWDAITNKYPRRCRPISHGPTAGGRRPSPVADVVEKGNKRHA